MPPNPPNARRRSALAHLLLLGVVLVWGTTFPLVKAALRDVSPLLFNLLRMTLAAALLLGWNVRRFRGLTRRDVRLGALVGALLALGYQLQTAGLARTTPSKSAFLTGLVVVLVPLLSLLPGVAASGTARPGPWALCGALVAFAGVVLLTAESNPGKSMFTGLHTGEWLTLGCALAFSAHLLTLARAAQRLSASRLGTLQISFAALFMLLTLPLGGSPHLRLTPLVLVTLGITSIFATAIAFTAQSWAQQQMPAAHVALLFTLEPVFAWLTSLLVLGEHLSLRALLGAALITGGILAVELGPTLRQRNPLLPLRAA